MTLYDLGFSLTVIAVITCGILLIGKFFDKESSDVKKP
jgi:hypothetical protein